MDTILNNNSATKELLDKYSSYTSIQQGYKIPNVVHYTFKSLNLSPDFHQNINRNKQICYDCDFIFYSDEQIEQFIITHFHERVKKAYFSINKCYGAMRADFFRYCVLYLIGGIYIDIKSAFKVPIFSLINKEDTCLLDIPHTWEVWRQNYPTYEQWVLIFAPQHPYLLNIIQLMVIYIEKKYIPYIPNFYLSTKNKILNITGPDAFTRAVNIYIEKSKKSLHRCIDYKQFFIYNNIWNYQKMYNMTNGIHYSLLNEPFYVDID